MKKTDILAYAVVCILAVFLFFLPFETTQASEVRIQTATAQYRYSLLQDRTVLLESEGITMTLVIENQSVFLLSSDCPDRVCVHTGKITKNQEVILCAPAHVLIQICAEQEAFDGTVY